jgi:hypothetical protein
MEKQVKVPYKNSGILDYVISVYGTENFNGEHIYQLIVPDSQNSHGCEEFAAFEKLSESYKTAVLVDELGTCSTALKLANTDKVTRVLISKGRD